MHPNISRYTLRNVIRNPRFFGSWKNPLLIAETFLYYPEKIISSSILEKCSQLCKGTFSVLENENFPQNVLYLGNLGKDSALGRATKFEPVHQQPT
jgi:hypothetical protein